MKDQYLIALGKRIEMYRKMKGLTMQELATKSGYNGKSSIYRIENGMNDISHRKLQQIAGALDVSVRDLLDGIDSMIELEDMSIQDKISQLNEVNKIRLNAYIDALLDSQKKEGD